MYLLRILLKWLLQYRLLSSQITNIEFFVILIDIKYKNNQENEWDFQDFNQTKKIDIIFSLSCCYNTYTLIDFFLGIATRLFTSLSSVPSKCRFYITSLSFLNVLSIQSVANDFDEYELPLQKFTLCLKSMTLITLFAPLVIEWFEK